MASNLRIFLSSTCNDLFQERRSLSKSLLDAGHSVILSELPAQFPVQPNLSCIENCLEAIRRHTDFILLVISSRYGSGDGSGRSITQSEYEEARRLGIPILTFVRRSILDLLPIYTESVDTDFSPVVEDNRVLEFVLRIRKGIVGNWVFPFSDVDDIVEVANYQISCHIRLCMDKLKPHYSGQLFYVYTNYNTILLSQDGACHRSVEFEIRNETDRPVTRIFGEDRSDFEMSVSDLHLEIREANGNIVGWDMTLDTPNHKTWDVILKEPFLPGNSIKFVSSYFSADRNIFETGHVRRAGYGLITYFFSPGTMKNVTNISLRNDDSGWIDNPEGAALLEDPRGAYLIYHYRDISGRWRFRVKWE